MKTLELARLRLLAQDDLIGVAVSMAAATARVQGMSPQDVPRLELVLEEACLNVVKHAFGGDSRAHYEVSVELRPPNLVVAVEDQGLPFDLRHPKESMGMQLMRAFCDRVEFLNLGKDGKRVELIKSLPYRDLESYLGAPPQSTPVDVETPLELRLMREDDTAGLARCAYRCYGFSYVRDTIYRPERFESLLREGLIISAVALTPDGEVVGHVALSRGTLTDKIADSGQAITDPRLRGRNLFTALKQLLAEEAKRIGLYGLYSESVTIHPYTQKANLKLGAVETALLLGFAPATVNFKEIAESPARSAAIMTYLRVNPEPRRRVYLPSRHAAILQTLYARVGLDRELVVQETPLVGETICDVQVIPELVAAHFLVQKAGEQVGAEVRRRLQTVDVTYLDLPLADPSTPAACRALEEVGFSLAGVLPESHHTGDVLRLQQLHGAMQSTDAIHTGSDWGTELKNYMLAEFERSRRL